MTGHVSNLEQELGLPLFDRTSRPIKPTPWGEEFVKLALPIVADVNSLAFRTSLAETERPVSISSSNAVVSRLLVRPLVKFRMVYPNAPLSIIGLSSYDMTQNVLNSNVDMGIGMVPDHTNVTSLEYEPLRAYRWVLLVPWAHSFRKCPPSSLGQIAEHPMIMVDRRFYTGTMVDAVFQREKIPYQQVMQVGSGDAMKECVKGGLGISFLPEFNIIPQDRQDMGIIPLDRWFSSVEVGILKRRGEQLSSSAEMLIQLVRDSFA